MNKHNPALTSVLSESVNWNTFFTIVETTGDSLNGRKDRFDKSDILEKSLEECSRGSVTWVDEIGWDHEIKTFTSEMKSQKHCLFTPTGRTKQSTGDIKLMNSLGDASARSVREVLRFDYLLLVDTGNSNSYAAAYIAKDNIQREWLDFKKDGVILKAPLSAFTFVVSPKDVRVQNVARAKTYKHFKDEAQRKFLEQFKS